MSVKKKLIRNTIINYGIRSWGFLLTFVLFWYIVRQIGEEDYGIYLFVGAIIGYFGILNLGISNSLVKFVSQYHTEDDKEKLNEVDALQKEANQTAKEMLIDGTTDVHNVVIAMQKAELGFRLMMQIRNKVVSAYQEIMRMPV